MFNKDYIIKYSNEPNPFVVNKINNNSVVLDVGCWTGGNGLFLIKNKNCIVDGIDFNDNILKQAKNNGYDNVYSINLNQSFNADVLKNNKYDYVILADILEHLIYPGDILSSLFNKLKNNGSIVISIPNIAFALYRIKLLFGVFDYNKNGGIMDISHLRFFTKRSVMELCQDAGYKIIFLNGYSIVKRRYFFLRFLAKAWPTLFALQYVICAKKFNKRTGGNRTSA